MDVGMYDVGGKVALPSKSKRSRLSSEDEFDRELKSNLTIVSESCSIKLVVIGKLGVYGHEFAVCRACHRERGARDFGREGSVYSRLGEFEKQRDLLQAVFRKEIVHNKRPSYLRNALM